MKYRIFFLLLLVLSLISGTVAAKPIITADRKYLDISTGLYVLSGNVSIENGDRIITAGQAKVNMFSLEVWGTEGVTVTQGDLHFKGDRVYVNGPRDQAQIDGGISYSRTGLQVTAESAEYNWKTRTAIFAGNVQVTQNGTTWTTNQATYSLESNTFIN